MITATAIFKFKRVKTLWSFNKYFSVNHFKHQFQTDHKNVKDFYDIPGPKSYPVVGTLYKYFPFFGDYDAEELHHCAWVNWCKYGDIVREVPGINLVHVYDPEVIEDVFRQKEKYPARRSHIAMLHYRLSKPNVYNTGGLLSTNGPDWWRIRSAFQKNFSSPQNAKQYVDITDNIAYNLVQIIKTNKITHNEDFLDYLNRFFLDVIGAIAFDKNFDSFSESEQHPDSCSSKIIKAAFGSNSGIMKLDKGILWRFCKTPLYRQLEKSQEYLEKISTEILLNKIQFYKKDDSTDRSLLASFVKLSNIDLKDIVGVMVDILMAAIDTTSYTTSFALYHLAQNKTCQEKLYNEVLTLLPSTDSKITADVLAKAVYLRSCVKESLRLNPVSIGVGRVLQNDVILKGYLVPKGTVIVTQNMIASRLPQYLKDPSEFKPERWIRNSPEYEHIHPFLSLPFGFGSRACIARHLAEQNISITLMRLIKEFHIKWMGGKLGVKTYLINKPDQPISLQFTTRSS
ncbi:cytochrome P450 302a1, mitochondrial [Danaus plexippus]|uniref:cytochrome P450 302a1, mitochondrial n=1 Tax=Danaus plexippus TaxID=13037 RepID=UPI002AB0F35E|nr:cytochrome P450 302a1, mitochondrial [Danaus plexippus]